MRPRSWDGRPPRGMKPVRPRTPVGLEPGEEHGWDQGRSVSADREANGEETEAPRLIGRAHQARGQWQFEPARRWRGGRRTLVWRAMPAPQDGDFCIAEVPDSGPAHLVEGLGAEDRPEWDDAAVASQYRLRTRFPARAEREARAFHEPG